MEKDAEGFVDRAAAIVGVAIDPALRPAVVANFAQFMTLFARLDGFEASESPDPAAVYKP